MRLNLKKSRLVALACTFGINASFLNAQTCQISKEWPADPGLRDVLIDRTDQFLSPVFFIYPGQAVSADNKNAVLARWKNTRDVMPSPGHSLLGVFLPGEQPIRADEPHLYEFKVFDSNGKVTFKLSGMSLDIAERPFYFLTDTKRALVTCSYWGDELQFYNRQGRLLNERRFIQEGTLSRINPKGSFSDSGHLFLFNLSRAREDEEKIGPDLFMFSANGSRLWQYQLPLKSTGAVGISGSGKFVAVSGSVVNPKPPQPPFQTVLFDSLGSIIGSFPAAFRHYDFDRDDRWLLLSDNYKANLVSLIKKSIYLELTPGSGRRVITDCALLTGNLILILSGLESAQDGETLYDDPEILIYSPEGELLFRQIFMSDYTYRGDLILNSIRNRFGITLQNRFVVFEMLP